jgi:RimJ/RimL family protein N-acetyltransferase
MFPATQITAVTHEDVELYGVRRCLADGSPVVVRQLEPDDRDLLLEVFEDMGAASREARFLAPKPRLTEADVRQLLAVDHVDHEALVALAAEDCRAIGIARFVRDVGDPETAEVAVEVVDRWQARGLGTMLVTALLGRARDLGLRRFTLVMARDNQAAARLMQRSAPATELVEADAHTVDYVITLTDDEPAWAVLKGA